MKKLTALLLALTLIFSLMGCDSQKEPSKDDTTGQESTIENKETNVPETTIRVGALKGPTAMGMVSLMDENEREATAPLSYEFTVAGAVDEISTAFVKGDLDVAAIPANLASVLYNNTEGKVQVLTINTLGVLYLVEKGESVSSIADLKGKTIYTSGKGATPEYTLNYLLQANGLDPAKDVTIEFKSEHTECVSALAANEDAVALLPQPFVTTAQLTDENIRVAVDLNKAWEDVQKDEENKSALLTGVLVAKKDFVEKNKAAIDLFLTQYEASVKYVNANTEDSANLIERFGIIKAAVASKALPYCCISYIDGAEMKTKLSGYLEVLYNQNPAAVGKSLPKDDFYYAK